MRRGHLRQGWAGGGGLQEREREGSEKQEGGAREQLLLNKIIVLLTPYIVPPTRCVITLRMTVQLTYILGVYNYCLGCVIVVFVTRHLLHCNLSKFLFVRIKEEVYICQTLLAQRHSNPERNCAQ